MYAYLLELIAALSAKVAALGSGGSGSSTTPYLLAEYRLNANGVTGNAGPSGTSLLTLAMMKYGVISSKAPSAPTSLAVDTLAGLGIAIDSSAPTVPYFFAQRRGAGAFSIVPADATKTVLDFGGPNNDDWDPLTLDPYHPMLMVSYGDTVGGKERWIVRAA